MAFGKPDIKERKVEKKPAPITQEDPQVKQAGQMELEKQQKKEGRSSTIFSDIGMKTGFSGMFNKKTGGV